MKYRWFSLLMLALASCASKYEKAEDAQDAGRQFIRASLDGDYKRARFYLLEDSTNLLLIDKQKHNYEELTNEQKQQHRDAAIRPIAIQKLNDSVTLYRYYNTYNPKDTTSMTIVRSNGDWLVDLKSILKH